MRFETGFTRVRDMEVEAAPCPKTKKQVATAIKIAGLTLEPSHRFWVSLMSRYQFNTAFFKYFSHLEVFDRISKVESDDQVRYCFEDNSPAKPHLLAATGPEKPIVVYDELTTILRDFGGDHLAYHEGQVQSCHTPRVQTNMRIEGVSLVTGPFRDNFHGRFAMVAPIDAYGLPTIYLMMEREDGVQTIAWTKAFKAGLHLGRSSDDVRHSITRALDQYNNEEGYAALVARFQKANESWASVSEAYKLYELLIRMYNYGELVDLEPAAFLACPTLSVLLRGAELDGESGSIISPALKAFHALTGDISALYGLANVDALSDKKKRTLPVKCSVYELLRFTSEVASLASTAGTRRLHAFAGELVGSGAEYDLEGVMKEIPTFDEFYSSARATNAAALAKASAGS